MLATDDNYAQHCYVTAKSIIACQNPNIPLNIYVIISKLSEDNKQALTSLSNDHTKIILKTIDDRLFEGYPHNARITISALYRLKAASMFPDLDKILYLDCDIVVQKDLSELFYTDISAFAAAAVKDINSDECLKHIHANLLQKDYFNSGVMLINLKKWRDEKLEKEFQDLVNSATECFLYHDQDILNITLNEKVMLLPAIWNFHHNHQNIKNEEAAIIHYIWNKPWNIDSKHPLRNEYWKFLETSPFCQKYEEYINYWRIHDFEFKLFGIPLFCASADLNKRKLMYRLCGIYVGRKSLA